MSLSLTPINEAWKNIKTPQQFQKKEKNKNKQNIYSNPETQSKILTELGMIENHLDIEEPNKQIEIQNMDSLNINLKNPELVNMLKPYSNDYIETIILNCINKKDNSILPKEIIDTIETMYMMISFILLLIIVDVLFKIKRN